MKIPNMVAIFFGFWMKTEIFTGGGELLPVAATRRAEVSDLWEETRHCWKRTEIFAVSQKMRIVRIYKQKSGPKSSEIEDFLKKFMDFRKDWIKFVEIEEKWRKSIKITSNNEQK